MSLVLKDPWLQLPITPMIKIMPGLYAKLETVNPTGSIKDRPIKFIVEAALKTGKIKKGTMLVEATSGNTGIALSAIGASLGLEVKIVMPRNMSIERRQMMLAYGAQIIDVPDSDFTAAIDKRNEMVAAGCWSPMQFENKLNIECHKSTTAKEILSQMPPEECLSAFISGAGTGGTIMGIRQALLDANLKTDICMVVPEEAPDAHGIQGIGDGADFLADPALCDIIMPVKTLHAKQKALDFAKSHGILVGISSGANLVAAESYIKTFNPDGNVVTILCDRGERYLNESKTH
jgi:cysteine synthase